MVKATSDTITLARVDDGVGIQSVTEYYTVSASNTTAPTSWTLDPPEMTTTNKYLWNYETITYTDGSGLSTKKRVIGAYGDKGATGATGKGISSVTNYYLATDSSSGVTTATSGWTSTIQSVTSTKKYLWNYETVTFTDKTTSSTDPCIIGSYGDKGDAGKGIASTAVTYQVGTSAQTKPAGTWSTSIPKTTLDAPYLWTKTVITYTDKTTSESYSVSSTFDSIEIGGRNLAERTNQGTMGWSWSMQAGKATTAAVTENKISTVKFTRDTTTQSGWSVIMYSQIGRSKYEANTNYTISVDIKPSVATTFNFDLKVSDGSGTLLTKSGLSSKLTASAWNHVEIHVKTVATLPTATNQCLYLTGMNSGTGVTYQFKNLKIEKGNVTTDWTPAPEDSIASVDVEYYLSTSSTALSGGSWSTTAPTWVNGKYMWSRTVKTDGAGNKTYSPNQNGVCIAGAKGSTGATGKGITSIIEEYYKSTSATELKGGSWSGTYPGWANGAYIWTRSTITYTDKSTSTTEPICVTGEKGEKGEKGDPGEKGETGSSFVTLITAFSYTQAQIDNYSATSYSGTWAVTTSSGVKVNDTVLIRVKNTTKNGYSFIVAKVTKVPSSTSVTATSMGLLDKGETGATGATGKGVKSTAITYQISSSATTAPTGTWTAAVPKTTAASPYLWTRAVITYTDNTSTTLYSVGSTPEGIVVGGRNLLSNTDVFYTATKDTSADRSYRCTTPANLDLDAALLNKQVTLSMYLYTPGERAKSSTQSVAEIANRFGVHGAVTYKNKSTGAKSDTSYPFTSLLRLEVSDGKRVSATATFTPPSGYDSISSVYLTIQLYARPASANSNTWKIGQFKLEVGNKATDWTPAPEDVDEKLTNEINNAYTNFTKTASDIMFEAVKEYVKTSDLEAFRQEISTQFTQTAESIEMTFNKVTQRLEDLSDDTDGEFAEIKSYIRFEDGNIILGKEDNPLILTLKNNRISFASAGQEVAYFSDNRMYVSNVTITTSADIVGLKITMDSDNIFIDW